MSPRRERLLLLVLLLAQLFLLASQLSDPEHPGSALSGLGLRLFGPPARLIAAVGDGLGDLARGWRGYRALARENAALRQRVLDLERDRLRLAALELDIDRLARATGYVPPAGVRLRPVDVVYADFGSWLRSLVLYVGSPGARPNQPVLGRHGLVGRVLDAAGAYARVQLLSDHAASAAALLPRLDRQGVLRGGAPGEFQLDFVRRDEQVAVGDLVVTAGTDGVYPRGLPLGTVVEVAAGSELFWRIAVRPAADFAALDQVYLLEVPVAPPPAAAEEPRGVR